MSQAEPYEIVIGLEVHAQLMTHTKLFCADTTKFGEPPNTQVSIVSLGHPGTLPKMNKEAINLALKLGLATNCSIVQHNYFARKNYFYPDLPKGYQVSQHTTPICKTGVIEITTVDSKKHIRINRIHIEEDAGKSLHDEQSEFSNIDYNRAGIPLLEIVSEPDLRSAEEAAAYVTYLRKLVRHLGVCDGNMEEGSLRCDVNISVRKKGDDKLGTRVEIKNLNSIRYIKKAIACESKTLIEKLVAGEQILQQTKGYDEAANTTYVIRTKEDEDDYRYFPEPDLPPFFINDEWIESIRKEMPPLQQEIRQKLIQKFSLSEYDAAQLSEDMELSDYFFHLTEQTKNYKAAANWVLSPIKNYCLQKEIGCAEFVVSPSNIAELIRFIDEKKISYGIATQKIFPELISNPETNVEAYIQSNQLYLQSPDEADELINAALNKHADKIAEYKKGKKGLLSVFVGEVMKLSKGKADAKLVTEKLIEKLKDK